MMIKVSFLVAASVAAYAVSHKNRRKVNQFASIEPSPENDEMEDEESEVNGSREVKTVDELEVLQVLGEEVKKRKLRLQRKTLELCGQREEESYIYHLKNQLDEKSLEIEILSATIASMQAERKDLHEDVKQCALARKQLETARKVIRELQEKIEYCNVRNMKMKARLLMLEKQVSNFPRDEDEKGKSVRDEMVEKKLKCVRSVDQLQVLKMRRRNKELEFGKRALAVKLDCAQEKIASLSNINEYEYRVALFLLRSETIAKFREEINKLRQTNEDLSRQVEKSQTNRFDMVQQLVYQRWLYTCLKCELQTHKSCETMNPSYESASSRTSTSNLSGKMFDTTTMDMDSSSSSSQRSSSTTGKSYGFMHRIKKWGTRKSKDERSSSKKGLVRRFSTSMVPLTTSILRNKGDNNAVKSSETPILSRARRVSFNDSIKSTIQSQEALDDPKEGADEMSTCSAAHISTQTCNAEIGREMYDEPPLPEMTLSPTVFESIHDDSNTTRENGKEMATVSSGDQENMLVIMGLIAALFFILFILVAYLTY